MVGFVGVCLVGWKVVFVMWCKMIINWFVVGFVEGINYVQYVVVYVSVEVVDVYVWFVCQFFYCYDVIVCQIYYVDVIVYVSIIFGWIIVIKNCQ